jgi:hypothetical protein
MKIQKADLIESLVWYAINKVIFKKPSGIKNKEDLQDLVSKIAYDMFSDGSYEIPTQEQILLTIDYYKKIDKLIMHDNYVVDFKEL